MLRKFKKIIIINLSLLLLVSCNVYKMELRQGNELDLRKLDQLRPNQSKAQVQEIIGTEALEPLKAGRLDYYFLFTSSDEKITKQQRLTLFFDNNGNLNHYISDHKDLVLRHVPKKKSSYHNSN